MEINAKKRLGQNFISDPNLIKKIVDLLGENHQALVIEIGPGTGALTRELVKKFDQVLAIEIDQDLIKFLEKDLKAPNLTFLNQDILKIDFKELVQKYQKNNQEVYLISNLPYYITSEILFKTLTNSSLFKKAIFMMQKEVAQRICASKNENNYNNLSVAVEFYSTKKLEFIVSKNKFKPIPKVDSAIVSLIFKETYKKQVENDQEFINFVRQVFNQRRKTILNNLTNVTKNKQKALEILQTAEINSNLRPENLDIKDFIKIYHLFINVE